MRQRYWIYTGVASAIATVVLGGTRQAKAQTTANAQIPQTTMTVDSVIARNIAARGGLARIRAIQSERLNGQIRIGPGAQGPLTLELKRPNHMRMEMTLADRVIMRGYDGHVGWSVNPFAKHPVPKVMSDDDTKNASTEADIDGPLVDYAAKGNKVELLGLDTLGVKTAYKLRVTMSNGDVDAYYVDSHSYLIIKWEGARIISGSPSQLVSIFTNYKPVDGVMFPFRVTSYTKGDPQSQELVFETISVNAAVPDTRFTMPDSTAGK
jgi:outer membrane lipoprotein-sorting protein